MKWMNWVGECLIEYLRDASSHETEFSWLIEHGGEALISIITKLL